MSFVRKFRIYDFSLAVFLGIELNFSNEYNTCKIYVNIRLQMFFYVAAHAK